MAGDLWVIGGGPVAQGVLRDPLSILKRIAERIEIDPVKGCFLWNGRLSLDGHGLLYVQSLTRLVHRLTYALRHGPIPSEAEAVDGRFCVLHRCYVGRCCNTDHLYLGNKKENGRDLSLSGNWRGGRPKLTSDDLTERVQLMLDPLELRDVDDFRFAERCPSRSEAIRILMQRGLAASRGRTEKDGGDAR